MKFVCQISIPLRMGRVRVSISCQKCDFSLKHKNSKKRDIFWDLNDKTGLPRQRKWPNLLHFWIFFCCSLFAIDVLKKFQPILFCQSWDNWGQSLPQTDKFFDTIYRGMWIFLSVKFATSLLASLAGGWC